MSIHISDKGQCHFRTTLHYLSAFQDYKALLYAKAMVCRPLFNLIVFACSALHCPRLDSSLLDMELLRHKL